MATQKFAFLRPAWRWRATNIISSCAYVTSEGTITMTTRQNELITEHYCHNNVEMCSIYD